MRLELEETVQAPQALVFGVFTDLQQAGETIDSITKMEVLGKGPVGKGTRFRETRMMFGKEATEEMEIAEFDPPRMYMVRGYSCGTEFDTTYRFDGGQRQTKVTMTMESRPKTLYARVLGPLFGLMMRKTMTKMLDADHAQLVELCEARAAEA